ncbi:MAG: hypothetical protein JWO91_769 [Acidobacteriaceae bacterium]|nr:hypothetical protein [Acidobacteriaceae bacterium]
MASEMPPGADGLALNVTGNPKEGYSVALLFNGKPFAGHNHGGEFSAFFQNEERSVEDRVNDWKATSCSGNSTQVVLEGECQLKNLNTTVFAHVHYELVTPHVVRKNVRLQQDDMFMLFYQLSNRLQAEENPARFWSFDQLDSKGGSLHEYFPAAGFRTKNGLCVGLLTDSGYRNQWTRIVRRDGRPVKPAPRRIPDVNLYSGPDAEERSKGHFFVQQTFGEIMEEEDGKEKAQMIALPKVSSWKKQGEATLDERDGVAAVSTKSSDDGVIIPFAARACGLYSVRVEYRSAAPVAVQIWDVDEQSRKVSDISLYNDRVPESPGAWSEFRTTVFVPGLEGHGCAVFISVAPSEQDLIVDAPAGFAKVEVRGLEIRLIATRSQPYHRLEMGRAAEKTVFVFADETVPDTVRGHRLASQVHLADGLGFKGGETEKVVYADLMMLCWIAGPETFRPICAPSIWYSAAGEMYLRDSFFALNGIHNRELNESVFNLWGENQGADGAINTLVEPNLANVERKSNDSTPLWLLWAFLNRRRFGTKLPMEKVRRAAEYCLRTYDPHREGICWAQFVMGQLDVIRYPEGTSNICENQGVLAVTARAIKELQIPGVSETISEEYLGKVEDLYRSYYDPARKFMRPARDIPDAIGFAEIFPEFLSLWLFGRKILSDEMVVNHLDRIPTMMPRKDCPHPEAGGVVRPILIGLPDRDKGWKYFNESWHPMISDSFAASYANHGMDGIYYNGSSWMRIEVCGYVTGKLHGWSGAATAIANRLWAETNIAPDFPTSQEYIATDPAHPYFGYHRVFAWNSFVLQALELAGLRSQEMDPDHFTK